MNYNNPFQHCLLTTMKEATGMKVNLMDKTVSAEPITPTCLDCPYRGDIEACEKNAKQVQEYMEALQICVTIMNAKQNGQRMVWLT